MATLDTEQRDRLRDGSFAWIDKQGERPPGRSWPRRASTTSRSTTATTSRRRPGAEAPTVELGVFVVALVLIGGIALLTFGRMPFPTRRPSGATDVDDTRTAEPPGTVDDSG